MYGAEDKGGYGQEVLEASRRERMPAQQAGQEAKGEWKGKK